MTHLSVPKAVQDCHDLLVWLVPLLDQFPRNRRFTLGERLESAILTLLELLTEAAYSRNKVASLSAAMRRLAVTRHLWRAAMELKVINTKRYAHGAKLLDELGRQIGGWRKQAAVSNP